MARSLVVPGVSIATTYDVPPPLPARSGILGAVGVVDRAPPGGLKSVTTAQEAIAVFGAASRYSFPELFDALRNGVSEAFVSPVVGSGQAAELVLKDDEDEDVVVLRARAPGPWGNDLSIRVTQVRDGTNAVQRVRLEVRHGGAVIETHDDLVMREGDDDDLFAKINRESGVLVAFDPVFRTALPGALDWTAFTDAAMAASTTLAAGGVDVLTVTARTPGITGNSYSVEVAEGRATATVLDGGGDPSLTLTVREPGIAGAVAWAVGRADGDVTLTVDGRLYRGADVAAVVAAAAGDATIAVEAAGTVVPAVSTGDLVATRTVVVRGRRQQTYEDLGTTAAIVAALAADPDVQAVAVGADPALPAPNPGQFLTGGRGAGRVLDLREEGAGATEPPVVHITADGPDAAELDGRFRVVGGRGILDVSKMVDGSRELVESHADLSMDPDDPRYLPAVLEADSERLRAVDRYTRSRAQHFPKKRGTTHLTGGTAPVLAAWSDAVDRMATEPVIDLVLAGLQGWKDPALDGFAVQNALRGHARQQTALSRPRIAVVSVRPEDQGDTEAMLNHATRVADRLLALVAPAGEEGSVVGLLGHLDYFHSPTFKSLAPRNEIPIYSDGERNKLLGPEGNLCVIQAKRGRGTIVLRGLLADGFQISVVRVAHRCIREVNAIADGFIGELNNAESRNALSQMIKSRFAQMERDGALVPSVDGESPAFHVDVYASQDDTASGILRIDIAVRPVRAIDFIYATIRVKN